jgi:hypothetical protein
MGDIIWISLWIFLIYIMGIIQMLTGFYILTKFLNKKANIIYQLILVMSGTIILHLVQVYWQEISLELQKAWA